MTTFNSLGVAEALIKALERQGITEPAGIQSMAYPILNGKQDAWLSSSTGSGKTLAYLLPLINHVDLNSMDIQLAILAPTQELAVQIHDTIRLLYSDITPAPRTQLLIGNASKQRQKEKLKKKPHIVVGSCGRMLELSRDKKLKMHKCGCIVIDEADCMLGIDSIGRLEQLLRLTPNERQLVFASATDKGHAFELAQEMGSDVQWLKGVDDRADAKIEHFYIQETHRHKTDALRKLLNAIEPDKAIVFLHRNETAELVQVKLENRDRDLVVIHGELSKFERKKALDDFRNGKIKVLVSSDVSARGLDIKGVTHIINLDAPSRSEDYIHRAGRTGRMGATGITISIVAPNELNLIHRYEADLGIEITFAAVREGKFIISDASEDL